MMNFDNWGGGSDSENNKRRRDSSADGLTMIREDEDEQQPLSSSSQQEQHFDVISRVYPEDGRLVGTDAIFTSSSNVIPHHCSDVDSNPHKRMGIPTPSIYSDNRGEIHNIKVNNDKRINILYTKRGYLRSGDLHPNTQCDFVFSGKLRVWTLEDDGSTKITNYGAHDFITIPRAVPHVFEFVEDTVLAEWWEPPGFQAWFYKPYRDIVNKKMEELENDADAAARSRSSGSSGRKKKEKGLEILVPAGNKNWNTAKVVLGVTVVGYFGFVLGRRSR